MRSAKRIIAGSAKRIALGSTRCAPFVRNHACRVRCQRFGPRRQVCASARVRVEGERISATSGASLTAHARLGGTIRLSFDRP